MDGGGERTVDPIALMKIRQTLGFGVRRLKILKWLKDHPELDQGRWHIQGELGNMGESVSLAMFKFENVGAGEVSS